MDDPLNSSCLWQGLFFLRYSKGFMDARGADTLIQTDQHVNQKCQ